MFNGFENGRDVNNTICISRKAKVRTDDDSKFGIAWGDHNGKFAKPIFTEKTE